MNKKKLAIIGYQDGSAGQIFSYLDLFKNFKLAFFCKGDGKFQYVDISKELKSRFNKQIEFPNSGKFYNVDFIDSDDWVSQLLINKVKFAFCINPDNKIRANDIEICKQNKINLINIIHPSTIIMPKVQLGKNIWINANSFIGYKTEIKDGVIVNSSVSVDHHNVLDYASQLDPKVTTAGFVTIGKFSHIHTSATIINKITLGQNIEVGAGSLVLNDLEDNYLYYGSPAIRIKRLNTIVNKKKKIVVFADFNHEDSIKALNLIVENEKLFSIVCIITTKKSLKKVPILFNKFNIYFDGFPHKNNEIIKNLKFLKPDFGISTSFPNRIRVKIINLLNKTIYNFHPAVLPDNKGSHSSFYSIINNTNFGATMHLMNKDFDSGTILDQITFKNNLNFDADFIHTKSRECCLKLLKRNIFNMYNNEFTSKKNKKTKINFKKDINMHDTIHLDRNYTGIEIWNLIRAVHIKKNGLFFKIKNKKVKVIPKIEN